MALYYPLHSSRTAQMCILSAASHTSDWWMNFLWWSLTGQSLTAYMGLFFSLFHFILISVFDRQNNFICCFASCFSRLDDRCRQPSQVSWADSRILKNGPWPPTLSCYTGTKPSDRKISDGHLIWDPKLLVMHMKTYNMDNLRPDLPLLSMS